jgi:hypothetical protein
MLDRKESDKLLFETTALAVQLRQNQSDITNAIFEVDPTTGTIRNLAYAYTDQQFTQAGLLIDGVNAEIQLQAQRVTSAEDRITNAESELLLQAGQIDLRATYTEVNQAIAGAIDAVLPAYSFGFFNSNEGWVAVNGTLTPATSKINLTWGDIQNTSLSYVADENPLISISIERTSGSGWTGNIIVTFDDNSTQTYTGVIEDIPTGSVFVRNLNLDGESTYTGNVTGIRLVLGASVADTFTVNSITIGKPSAALTELEGITAQINQVGIDLNALEASLTNYVTVDQYTAEGVTRSNVETVLNGLDSYATIQATLQEFDTEDTLTKANYAALWVDAANANIEQTVQAYNEREGGLDDQLETITGDLVVASSLIDAANGRIQEQIVNISGIQSKSKDLEQVALQAEYQLYLSKKNQLEQGVAIALAKNELNTISNEQLALAEEILLLEAKFGTDVGQVNATLFELNQAIADETEARVQAVQTLETDFNQAISASATSILETVSNTEQSLSQQILNLQTEFNDEITTNVNQLLQAISDEESARIAQFNQLQTNFGNEIQAARTDLTNLISSETDAIASQITSLETNVQNNYASKTELTNAVTTERDARIESISTLESSFNSTVEATKDELTELVSDESSARATEINTLTTNFQNTYATKTEVTNLVTTETDARIEAIETLATNVEDNYATISEVQQIQNDVNLSKAISQTALVSISGVQKKVDSTALEQIIEGYRLYLAEKNQLEIGVSVARAETALQTETNERLALAQEVTVLEAKLGTAEGTFSAEINRLDRAIVDPDGAVASSILEATTVLEGDTRVPVSTIAIDARSLAEDNQEALATIKTELVGVDGSYNEAALILKTAVDDAGEAVSRAFLGTSVLQPGDEKYTITGLTVDSQTRGIRFQGDLFELVNGAGLRKLYWNDTENEWQIDGDVLLTGSIRGDALVANTITGDKIAANSISTDKLVANSVNADKLAANSVNADKIVSNTITGDKIAANTIGADKIIANSIGTNQLAANSVNADKIVANTITGDKIAANTISADKIVANTITADQIASNAITASKIQANAIDGKTITGSLIRTAASGTRVEIGNTALPIWYGTGTVNTTNGQFYVDDAGNVVARNKFSVNVGGNNLFYYDETTQTLTLNGRLIVGGYTVSSEADIRALDGKTFETRYSTSSTTPTGTNPSGWTITPPNTTSPIYASRVTRLSNGNIEGVWSTPVRWNGLQGQQGIDGQVGAGFYSVNVNTNKPTITTTYLTGLFTPSSVAGRNPVNKDTFFVKWLNARDAYEFNGTNWVAASLVVDGSIIASETIAGDRLIAGTEISGPIIKGGELIAVGPNTEYFEIIRPEPFGPQSDLVNWYGPKVNGVTWNNTTGLPIYSGMTKANAKTYKTKDGSVYFGGTFIAGAISNAQSSTTKTSTPSTQITFTSNGGILELAGSFSFTGIYEGPRTDNNDNSWVCPVAPVMDVVTGTLYIERQMSGGSWQIIIQHPITGSYSCRDGEYDPEPGTPNAPYKAVSSSSAVVSTSIALGTGTIVLRARAVLNNWFTLVENQFTSTGTSQAISITSKE